MNRLRYHSLKAWSASRAGRRALGRMQLRLGMEWLQQLPLTMPTRASAARRWRRVLNRCTWVRAPPRGGCGWEESDEEEEEDDSEDDEDAE